MQTKGVLHTAKMLAAQFNITEYESFRMLSYQLLKELGFTGSREDIEDLEEIGMKGANSLMGMVK